MTHATKRKWVRWTILITGAACIALSIPPFEPLLTWGRAVGTIEMSTSLGDRQPSPHISFTQADGTRWGHTPTPAELPSGYSAGDTITVLYHWKDAVVLSPSLWVRPIAISVVGVALVVLGLFPLAARH